MNFDISFEKHNSIFTNIRIYCFECPSRFQLQLQGVGTCQKKLDVKTFLLCSSNRKTQKCKGWKSRLSKLLSLDQKQLQKYNIRDEHKNNYLSSSEGIKGSTDIAPISQKAFFATPKSLYL